MSHQITEKEKEWKGKLKPKVNARSWERLSQIFALFLARDEDMEIRNEIHPMCVILRATFVQIKAIYSLY